MVEVKVGHKYAVNHMCQVKVCMSCLWQLCSRQALKILVIKHGICSLLLHVDLDVLCSLVRECVARCLRCGALASIQKRKVWEPLLINHVDPTVKHYGTAANLCNNAAAADILTRAKRNNLNGH